jgi:hypothetical protein
MGARTTTGRSYAIRLAEEGTDIVAFGGQFRDVRRRHVLLRMAGVRLVLTGKPGGADQLFV